MIARPNLPIFAKGGPEVSTRSKFLKQSDAFRNDSEKVDFAKSGKTGAMSKPTGDKSAPLPKKGSRK